MRTILTIVVVLNAMIQPAGGPCLGRLDFEARFKGFDGCFVMQPLNGQWRLRHDERRCAERLSPCSTFKIFNALAALEAKAVDGPDTKLKWDGTPQNRKICEQDHTLASAIHDSVVWYFQETASRVGPLRMQHFLDEADYGNRDISGGIRQFWLQSSLQISADEQVRFLARLYRSELHFSKRSTDLVKKMLVLERGDGWTLSGKSGSGMTNGKATLGWFVGHVKSRGGEYVFALNIGAADGANGFQAAKDMAKGILIDMGLIDSKGAPALPPVVAR